MNHMYGIAITYSVPSLLLLGGFAFSTYTCIFKNVNGTWKYSWMQRSQGTTDMTTWE